MSDPSERSSVLSPGSPWRTIGSARRQLATLRALGSRWAGLLVLVTVVALAGFALESAVGDLGAALSQYRLFFQLTLAGLVLYLLQNEVGLPAYGLFAPMIIAFILVAAGPLWGLALFLNVFLASLVAYEALAPLDLGTAPRVASLLTVACLATSGAMALGDLGLLPNAFQSATVTFPAVISAWYAERMASDVDERGWSVPAVQLLWTIVAIFAAYAVITSSIVDWYLRTPLAWAASLAVVAVLGSRPTMRLSEFVRFDDHVASNPVVGFTTAVEVAIYNALARCASWFGRDVHARSVSAVLPMKIRNQYIDQYNPDHARPAADRKALLKGRLNDLGIAAPDTYAVARSASYLAEIRAVVQERDRFVVKPSQGYGGEGILLVTGQTADGFVTNKGTMSTESVVAHVRRIVDGDYAGLEPSGDAIVEELLVPSSFFRKLCGAGIPDVRILVFRGYPVMAMARLPTAESGGAANLHLGGVGVGLHLDDGTPIKAYQQTTDRELERHPDTGADLTEFGVPNWEGVLDVAVKASAAAGLGYAGVDVVLDDDETPRILEVNVRPGLGIQNTTGEGILDRLELVESLPSTFEFLDPAQKVTLARGWDAANWDVSVATDPTDALADATEPWSAPESDEGPTRPGGSTTAGDGRSGGDRSGHDGPYGERPRADGGVPSEEVDRNAD